MISNINYCVRGLRCMERTIIQMKTNLGMSMSKFEKRPVVDLWVECVKHHLRVGSILKRKMSVYTQILRLVFLRTHNAKGSSVSNGRSVSMSDGYKKSMSKSICLLQKTSTELLHLEAMTDGLKGMFGFIHSPLASEHYAPCFK